MDGGRSVAEDGGGGRAGQARTGEASRVGSSRDADCRVQIRLLAQVRTRWNYRVVWARIGMYVCRLPYLVRRRAVVGLGSGAVP